MRDVREAHDSAAKLGLSLSKPIEDVELQSSIDVVSAQQQSAKWATVRDARVARSSATELVLSLSKQIGDAELQSNVDVVTTQ